MAQGDGGQRVDPELEQALTELLVQTEKEPISPRLRALARRLEAALQNARLHRGVKES